jgi:ferritin-like metal-binding protein YciE
MQIDTMEDLFEHELRGAYHMESRLVGILGEMSEKATNDRIASGFADHRDETEEHVRRVERAFEAIGATPEERGCPVVEALDEERRAVEEAVTNDDLLDMFYLGAGMKTERVEMTTYEGLLMVAGRLDLEDDVTGPLEDNLDSEESTFKQLQSLSTDSDLKSFWERLTP